MSVQVYTLLWNLVGLFCLYAINGLDGVCRDDCLVDDGIDRRWHQEVCIDRPSQKRLQHDQSSWFGFHQVVLSAFRADDAYGGMSIQTGAECPVLDTHMRRNHPRTGIVLLRRGL